MDAGRETLPAWKGISWKLSFYVPKFSFISLISIRTTWTSKMRCLPPSSPINLVFGIRYSVNSVNFLKVYLIQLIVYWIQLKVFRIQLSKVYVLQKKVYWLQKSFPNTEFSDYRIYFLQFSGYSFSYEFTFYSTNISLRNTVGSFWNTVKNSQISWYILSSAL